MATGIAIVSDYFNGEAVFCEKRGVFVAGFQPSVIKYTRVFLLDEEFSFHHLLLIIICNGGSEVVIAEESYKDILNCHMKTYMNTDASDDEADATAAVGCLHTSNKFRFCEYYGSSMSCRCRSLRAVKLNKIGLLNYKARHIFYSPEKMKFRWRCHYYRASVFQILGGQNYQMNDQQIRHAENDKKGMG
ncbi:hypothetical protein CTI12_AA196750 [Artemisia annua]|uniref:Uncharacterized protein n=1 Tax=Artemisia annua TaxID=35608 RepID=A0A2U1P3T1_ARTAN|nr:hypothetical protein CTI12_AA196750 [Artemisia annua]